VPTPPLELLALLLLSASLLLCSVSLLPLLLLLLLLLVRVAALLLIWVSCALWDSPLAAGQAARFKWLSAMHCKDLLLLWLAHAYSSTSVRHVSVSWKQRCRLRDCSWRLESPCSS
jgi:hypothetical protein